ncbi:hypothetical protein BDW59DRAFT_6060 [Aspergillus cavernicola]|uniref:Uncharacterized protein n=1 Tax=Aspergillus cavernicola TaxID=176166 RepID=A0ABR4J5H3_9EURO
MPSPGKNQRPETDYERWVAENKNQEFEPGDPPLYDADEDDSPVLFQEEQQFDASHGVFITPHRSQHTSWFFGGSRDGSCYGRWSSISGLVMVLFMVVVIRTRRGARVWWYIRNRLFSR